MEVAWRVLPVNVSVGGTKEWSADLKICHRNMDSVALTFNIMSLESGCGLEN